MTELMNSLKDHVETAFPDVKNVEIIPHFTAVPGEAGFPAVGIIDGGIEPLTEGIGLRDESLAVTIAVYFRYVDEDDIIGDSGILAAVDSIKDYFAKLATEDLDVSGCQLVHVGNISGIHAGALDQDFVIAKTIELLFHREVT